MRSLHTIPKRRSLSQNQLAALGRHMLAERRVRVRTTPSGLSQIPEYFYEPTYGGGWWERAEVDQFSSTRQINARAAHALENMDQIEFMTGKR